VVFVYGEGSGALVEGEGTRAWLQQQDVRGSESDEALTARWNSLGTLSGEMRDGSRGKGLFGGSYLNRRGVSLSERGGKRKLQKSPKKGIQEYREKVSKKVRGIVHQPNHGAGDLLHKAEKRSR